MRVIVLTHGGAELVLESLAAIGGIEIAGVFIETGRTPKRGLVERLRRSVKYDGVGGTLGKLLLGRADAAATSMDQTRAVAAKFRITAVEIENFHSEDSLSLLRNADADLGVIYGTNIIKENVFSIPRLGSINLHQGLAPKYRGGPPVFWELFNGEKEVGLTVHFVAPQVDTGDIILQKRIPLKYDAAFATDFEEFIQKYRADLRAESAELVAAAVTQIASGDFQRTAQDISIGKRYRLPTITEKNEMRRRLKQRLKRSQNG